MRHLNQRADERVGVRLPIYRNELKLLVKRFMFRVVPSLAGITFRNLDLKFSSLGELDSLLRRYGRRCTTNEDNLDSNRELLNFYLASIEFYPCKSLKLERRSLLH